MMSSSLLIAHAVATFGLTGIIWFVHLVHYPVMQSLAARDASHFEVEHWKRTMPIAVPMLVVELASGLALLVWPPPGIAVLQVLLGLVLMVAIWITTWGVCVPQHSCLKRDYSSQAFRLLMKANLSRAVLWLLRSAVVIWMLASAYNGVASSF